MKKVILTVLVAGSLLATSCKKATEASKELKETTEAAVKEGATVVTEGTKEVVAKTTEAVKSVLEGVTIPEFKDAKVGEHLTAYAGYAKEYIAAGTDAYKNTDLMKKGADLLVKGQEIVKGLDAEATAKFNTVMASIGSKMAPAAK